MSLYPNISAIIFFCMAIFLSYSKQSLAFDLPTNSENQVIIEILNDPDYFAFSPDGRMFISERITDKLLYLSYIKIQLSNCDPWFINPIPFIHLIRLNSRSFSRITKYASGSHNGCALQFENDNKLYISKGDGWKGNRSISYD